MGRRRKDGSSKIYHVGRNGNTPPDNTGKKYKKHVSPEEDGRRNNKRPEVYKDINVDDLKSLCRIGCTQREVESVLGYSQPVIDKYLNEFHGMSWKEFFKENADNFKMSLRRLQMRSAEGDYDVDNNKYNILPSVPMQIWLGKQFLGQKDRHENIIEEKTNIPIFEWADAEDVTNRKQLKNGEEEQESEDYSDEGMDEGEE